MPFYGIEYNKIQHVNLARPGAKRRYPALNRRCPALHFINKADAVDLPLDPETAIGHKLNLDGKELILCTNIFS